MNRFKVGDTVRMITNQHYHFKKGDEFEITGISKGTSSLMTPDTEGGHHFINPEKVERVEKPMKNPAVQVGDVVRITRADQEYFKVGDIVDITRIGYVNLPIGKARGRDREADTLGNWIGYELVQEVPYKYQPGDKIWYDDEPEGKVKMKVTSADYNHEEGNILVADSKWTFINITSEEGLKFITPRGKKTKARYEQGTTFEAPVSAPTFEVGQLVVSQGSLYTKEGDILRVVLDQKGGYGCDVVVGKVHEHLTPPAGDVFVPESNLTAHEYKVGDWVEFVEEYDRFAKRGDKVQITELSLSDVSKLPMFEAKGLPRGYLSRVKPCSPPTPEEIWAGVEYMELLEDGFSWFKKGQCYPVYKVDSYVYVTKE